mgnify:CR=1 FL=1
MIIKKYILQMFDGCIRLECDSESTDIELDIDGCTDCYSLRELNNLINDLIQFREIVRKED